MLVWLSKGSRAERESSREKTEAGGKADMGLFGGFRTLERKRAERLNRARPRCTELGNSSSVQRGRARFGVCQFCTALTCLGVRRARSSHLQAESWAIRDPVAASQWAARQRFGRAVKVSQGAPRHMAAGEHTVAAAAKNCIAMAPTSWRSIEGGSSAGLHIGRERGE